MLVFKAAVVGAGVMGGEIRNLDEGLAAERDAFLTTFTSEDAREGIAALLEKRRPKFSGK